MTATRPFLGETAPPAVHLMTLNVRRRMPRLRPGRADRWEHRRPALEALLDTERPGILGLQEVLPSQSAEIAAMLGDRYDSSGGGRDSHGGGERLELHVDAQRFRILESRTRWLSATPDVRGSRSFGNLLPRILLESVVQDRAGARWTILVTHLDHLSERSRRSSARLLADAARRLPGPVAVLGDFNTDAHSATHALLTEGRLVDAVDVAEHRPNPDWGSFSHYRPPRVGGRRLDWILVDRDTTVLTAGVNPARFDRIAASDHDPVQARVVRGDAQPSGATSKA
jgi:endonuclease/exonuclease/phosphatase family metal-dependent hydrolase